MEIGDRYQIKPIPAPGVKPCKLAVEYEVTDIWPDGTVISEIKRKRDQNTGKWSKTSGVRIIERPNEEEVIEILVDNQWVS